MKIKFFDMSWYNIFKCVGGNCPLTCCTTDWDIELSDEEIEMYRNIEEDFSREIMSVIDIDRKVLKKTAGNKCPLITEDGWCRIVINCGDTCLSNTCMMYPRKIMRYGDIVERTVDISCPVVASYLLRNEDIEFGYGEDESNESYGIFSDDMYYMYDALSNVRNFLMELWQSYDDSFTKGKYFVMQHLYGKIKSICGTNGFSKEEARRIIEIYSTRDVIMLMYENAKKITDDISKKVPIIADFMISTFRVIRLIEKDLPEKIDVNILNMWLNDFDVFKSDIQEYLVYFNMNYPYMIRNYWVYTLFLNWIGIDKQSVVLSQQFYVKCVQLTWIQIVSMMYWKKYGELNNLEIIISATDRVFDRSNEVKECIINLLNSYEMDTEVVMLLLSLF